MTKPLNPNDDPVLKAHLSRIGKVGGSKTSPRKKAAARKNADKAWRARWADRPQRGPK